MTIDYSQYGDVSGIERRRALAKMLESGSAMPMANGGRIVPTYGIGNAAVDIGRILLGNKLAGDASAQEQQMKAAYTQAMRENDAKAYEALNGTPEYKPNNMVELPRPAIAPDVQKAAQIFGNNPQREALANMLIQGQVTKGVNTAKAVDDRETARVAPYDPAKLAGVLPIGNLVNGAEGLTNANIGQQIGRALQVGGGVKTIDSGFIKDAATGTIEKAPLTSQQIADNKIKQDQFTLDKQRMTLDNALRQQSLTNDKAKFEYEKTKNTPEYQAKLTTAVENAKHMADLAEEVRLGTANAVKSLDLYKRAKLAVDGSANGGGEKAVDYAANFFGMDTESSRFESVAKQLGDSIALYGTKFGTGAQTKQDYDNVLSQIGIIRDFNTTVSAKKDALESALQSQINMISKNGSPEDKAAAAEFMKDWNQKPSNAPASKNPPKDTTYKALGG